MSLIIRIAVCFFGYNVYLCDMFQQNVIRYIHEKDLFAKNDKIVVALSGGADSVALLRVLLAGGYACVAVHCNFHLRGNESDRDEAFVRALCSKLHVPLRVKDFDTESYAETHRISSPG